MVIKGGGTPKKDTAEILQEYKKVFFYNRQKGNTKHMDSQSVPAVLE